MLCLSVIRRKRACLLFRRNLGFSRIRQMMLTAITSLLRTVALFQEFLSSNQNLEQSQHIPTFFKVKGYLVPIHHVRYSLRIAGLTRQPFSLYT